jgi:hypothetical protein
LPEHMPRPSLPNPTDPDAMPCLSWVTTVRHGAAGGGVNRLRWVHTAGATASTGHVHWHASPHDWVLRLGVTTTHPPCRRDRNEPGQRPPYFHHAARTQATRRTRRRRQRPTWPMPRRAPRAIPTESRAHQPMRDLQRTRKHPAPSLPVRLAAPSAHSTW